MKFEDISLLSALLVAVYVFPALWLTALRVTECLESAATRDPLRWWVVVPCARYLVGFALSVALFIFYLIFTIPLLVYGLCRPYCVMAWQGTGNEERNNWRERAHWIWWSEHRACGLCGPLAPSGEERVPSVWKSWRKMHGPHQSLASRLMMRQREAVRVGYPEAGAMGVEANASVAVPEGADAPDI
ncbi:hypothetical protein F5Y10DRAFT_43482 [Nemania abortiva]|nr:hypothetical protein F5Y10DRAFT_43482 [Nemania abortiva]